MTDDAPITMPRLLDAVGEGDPAALNAVVALLDDEFRLLARRQRRRWRGDHTLDTTALVHEAYLNLVQQKRIATESGAHVPRARLPRHAPHPEQLRGGAACAEALARAWLFDALGGGDGGPATL